MVAPTGSAMCLQKCRAARLVKQDTECHHRAPLPFKGTRLIAASMGMAGGPPAYLGKRTQAWLHLLAVLRVPSPAASTASRGRTARWGRDILPWFSTGPRSFASQRPRSQSTKLQTLPTGELVCCPTADLTATSQHPPRAALPLLVQRLAGSGGRASGKCWALRESAGLGQAPDRQRLAPTHTG